MSNPDQPQRGLLPALGWACYLGSSWTWVVGMFFPILLLRDFGLAGWITFAIPNVIGAAAMGFVLTRESSARVVNHHTFACRSFSEITIAFHIFVLGWLVWHLFGGTGLAVAAMTAAAVVEAVRRNRGVPAAVIVTLVSLGCIAAFLTLAPDAIKPSPLRLTPFDLAMFAPASLVGFALCPYLDLTFHRARQTLTPTTGKIAFALGFGGIFLSMILFAMLYAPAWTQTVNRGATLYLGTAVMTALLVHVCVQIGLTVGLHAGEASRIHTYRFSTLLLALLVAVGTIALVAYLGHHHLVHPDTGLTLGECGYRTFLLFYGLVFPAYVWLCMIPTWREISSKGGRVTPLPSSEGGADGGADAKPDSQPRNRRRLIFALATLIALPMGFAGFVLGLSAWIPASLAVLLLARIPVELMSSPDRITPQPD